MPRRYHSSTAVRTVLSGGISNSDTIITVDSVSGFPGTKPYTLILDFDTVNEEIVTVTGGSGTTLNVTRGEDGTGAVSHLAGAVVVHGLTARDVDEPNAHINVGSGVHGVAGDVVGTTDAQTLTNKTIDGGDNTLSNIPQSAVTDLESDLAAKAVYPSQTGNSGKVLGTDGSSVSWVTQLAGPKGDPGDPGADGADGADGAPGTDGADGVGVPAGGTTGQLLAKHSGANYDTEWVTGLQLTDSTSSTSTTTAATPNSVKSAYDLASTHKTRHATGGSDALSPSDIGAATSADLALREPIVWRSGRYYGVPRVNAFAYAPGTGLLTLTPIWVPAACTLDRITCVVSSTIASGTARLGLYANDSSTDRPSSLIVDAGTVNTASSTGVKEATISQAVSAGWLWVAYVAQTAAATIQAIQSLVSLNPVANGSVNDNPSAYYITGVTGALPSTVSTSSVTVGIRQHVRLA